jgi:hypothetical protein
MRRHHPRRLAEALAGSMVARRDDARRVEHEQRHFAIFCGRHFDPAAALRVERHLVPVAALLKDAGHRAAR